jgi:TrpR-related protein YerC/YecD
MKPNRDDTAEYQKRKEDALFRAVQSLHDVHETRKFFKDLCTPAELQALVDRWQVVVLLQKDLPYRRIHELTGVSVTPIGRVARFLTDGFGGYETAIERTGKKHLSRKSSATH